jgi:hypothetical protein
MNSGGPILLIKPPLIGAGFGACLVTILNYVRYCEREGLTPVVHIDVSCNTKFLDSDWGDNVWEQYFEPVGPYSSETLQRMLTDPAHAQQVSGLRYVDDTLPAKIKADRDSIFSWTFGQWRTNAPEDIEAWFEEQRRKGRESVRKHVRVKSHVMQKVDAFFEYEMRGKHVLGVHIRGTDLHYAPPVSPAEYFGPIDRYLEAHPGAAIFLATDQLQYLQVMQKRYGKRVLSYACLRSATSTAPFEMEVGSPYQKGEDVLIDILLLSKCEYLVRGASNVPETALYFNLELVSLDLSLKKRFAFGQDYGERWFSLATRPAWEMVGKTDLERIPDDASSQDIRQRARYEWRRTLGSVTRARRNLKRALRQDQGRKKV